MTDKTPLVLIPGLLCDAALWRHQIDHLGDVAEIRVADVTRQSSMAEMAAAVLAAAPAERFALAALSMGGYVAFEVMRRAPDRVARLALFDTSARDNTPEQARRRTALMDLAQKGQFKGVTRRILELFIHPERLSDTELVNDVMAMAKRVGREAFLRQQEAMRARPDSRPDLGGIRCPTIVACGRQDPLTPPAWSEEIAAGIPEARLVVVEDCGHLTTMERPQAATAVLRLWLTL